MKQYETIFICREDLPEEKVQELTEKVKSIILQSNGEIISLDNWGSKKLAYPIAHQKHGKYIYIDFVAKTDTIEKIENFYNVTEGIIRFLTVKKPTVKQANSVKKSTEQGENISHSSHDVSKEFSNEVKLKQEETTTKRGQKNGTKNSIT